ncbi:hypothetical protein KUTeg_001613 [Tegillarca granosa]|uniref:Uncharacterized protein n=1 Tax=Tegillarca granosa TaxID=220873 RepID=A0ABQ9FTF5_TEGGR|nr:hypothetical protein KUTeg_001613 [Tegillarca granosa]
MASDRRIREAGWFYHAPAKRTVPKEPPLLPLTSQIPGLNNLPPQPEDEPKALYRDTDSKYIRLAKKGGREDLLRFKENANLREKAPVSYPRNEWFYLADNALEDAELEEKKPYAFLLPEYMVHESHKPDGDDANYERPRRAPFAFDNKSAYEREGDSIKDKTLKLPEVVKSGPSEEKKPPKMSKLLSNEYDREWHEDITKWQMKQDMLRDKFKAMATDPNKQEPISSEYRSTYGKKTQKPYKNEKERKVWETKPKIDTYVDTSQKAVQGNNDLFKMSK